MITWPNFSFQFINASFFAKQAFVTGVVNFGSMIITFISLYLTPMAIHRHYFYEYTLVFTTCHCKLLVQVCLYGK